MLCRWVSDAYTLSSRVARLLTLLDPECDYDLSKLLAEQHYITSQKM